MRLTGTQKREMNIVSRAIQGVGGRKISSIQCWMERNYGFSFNEKTVEQIIRRIDRVQAA